MHRTCFPAARRASRSPDRQGHLAADARVHLVEDQRADRVGAARTPLIASITRESPRRRRSRQAPERLAEVRRDQELHLVLAGGRIHHLAGLVRPVLEVDLETHLGHAELPQLLLDPGRRPGRPRAAAGRSPPPWTFSSFSRPPISPSSRFAAPLAVLHAVSSCPPARVRQHLLDRAAVLPLERADQGQALLHRVEPPGAERRALAVLAHVPWRSPRSRRRRPRAGGPLRQRGR